MVAASKAWSPNRAIRRPARIVLRNLLDNALKFSRASEPPRIEVTSSRDSNGLVLCVQDNGIGFRPEYQDEIFEIFSRLHSSGYEGTGVGLALARKTMRPKNRPSVW